jgi:hypothetical protein
VISATRAVGLLDEADDVDLDVAGRAPEQRFLERIVNGQPGLVAQQDGVTVTVFAFHVEGCRIRHIWAIRNPLLGRRTSNSTVHIGIQ